MKSNEAPHPEDNYSNKVPSLPTRSLTSEDARILGALYDSSAPIEEMVTLADSLTAESKAYDAEREEAYLRGKGII